MKKPTTSPPAQQIDRDAIDRVIQRNLRRLRQPGVLTARPGYQFSDGRITGRPAIVVTVARKRARVPAGQELPKEIDGIPVDVRPSTALQRLRDKAPAKHALLARFGSQKDREPVWPHERRVSDGKLVSSIRAPRHPAWNSMAKKPQIAYTAAKVPLAKVSRPITILACASPDAGFTVLAEFLEAATRSLTVALYDFTSGDILRTLTGVIQRRRLPFKMVLDHPSLNATANQSDGQTAQSIGKADRGATVMWALTETDPDTDKWIFPTAYHIKVAVRDSSAFWLSSGNWNVSNQPNLAARRSSRGALDTADRDWHVVMLDEGLARVFEAYIAHDYEVASGVQANRSVQQRQLKIGIEQAAKQLRAEQKKQPLEAVKSRGVPFTLGKAKVFTKAPASVQPLLTPDRGRKTSMYAENVLALIRSARKTLYMQYQYIHPTSGAGDEGFTALVDAVATAVRRKVDVRVICSQYENTPQYIELMHERGLSSVLRVQDRVHNKGIVVDSKTVLVSSQNWSAQGVLQNRDAGVIIGHPGIAQYFEASFLQDWQDRASVRVSGT
jgi:hypothetical protein